MGAGLLRRIFVDECHTAMTDVGYRPKLEELKSLHRFGCPLVMLTATLPVVLEDWFRKLMLASSAAIVRDRTAKLNCRYRVEQIKPGKGAVMGRTVEIARQIGGRMVGRQKGVIYCRSIAASESLAEELGCGCQSSVTARSERRGLAVKGTGGSRRRPA
jgi:superfamily II DNA helicase RecQ